LDLAKKVADQKTIDDAAKKAADQMAVDLA